MRRQEETKMLKAKVSDVSKYIELAWKQRKPLFLHGAPGIGKSSVVRQAAEKIAHAEGVSEFFVKDIRLSQMDPTDLGGLPIPVGDEDEQKAMGRIFPEWWPTGNEFGIIFFDELNKGTPSTQAAAYQLILDRRMGDRELSPNVMIVAAGNRSSDNVTVYDMDSALQNRFPMHIEVEVPTKDELEAYFTSIDKNDMKIFGFWNYSERSIWRYDDKGADPSWASPRSWEFLADLLELTKEMPKADRMREMKALAVSAVGDVVGREFAAYVRLNEVVDIDAILDNPKKFAEIERPDVKHSVITEIADRYKRNKNLEKKAIEFVFGTTELPEYVMLALSMFSKANKNFVQKVVSHPKGAELAEHMEKFI
jgi:MoxR-like ATPase